MINNIKSEFTGTVGEWIGISIGCFFLSLIPFIGLPLAICIKERWIKRNTKVVGMQLQFVGKAGDLLGKMIKWGFLFIITLTIYGLFIPVRFREWKAENTVFAFSV